MARWRLYVGALVCALVNAPADAFATRDMTPGNQTVDFARFGDWEVWCIRLVRTDEVVCDLNNVLDYVPHPNFRALIPRVDLDPEDRTYVEIEHEWRTALEPGWFEVPGRPRFAFEVCGEPCVFEGPSADELVALWSAGGAATLRLYDFVVEPHDVTVDLDGFVEGLAALKAMPARHRN